MMTAADSQRSAPALTVTAPRFARHALTLAPATLALAALSLAALALNVLAFSALMLVPSKTHAASAAPNCQALARQAPLATLKSALDSNPADLKTSFALADAWSDAGCFNEAVQVLQAETSSHPESQELSTRLRVAKSLVGEEHYFDNLDRADAEAKLKRASFRCTSLGDIDACNEALRLKPDDPTLVAALANAQLHTRRPQDAATAAAPQSASGVSGSATAPTTGARVAANSRSVSSSAVPPASKSVSIPVSPHAATHVAQAVTPQTKAAPTGQLVGAVADVPRRYSNAAPEARSH